jgi:choline dehydrogenase
LIPVHRGGTAGLVIANRLSENSSITVAVLEAGTDGSAVEDSILNPAQAYLAGIANLDSDYDWHYQTTNQSELNNRQIYWPRGKVLGGSSAVNGL